MPAEILSGIFLLADSCCFRGYCFSKFRNRIDRRFVGPLSNFLPRVVAFGLILIFGIVFAGFLGKVFQVIAGNLGIKEAKTIGRLLQAVIIIYAAIMALEQLGIAVFAVAASFNILWAAICLTLVLALGLGGKDLVKSFLDNFMKNWEEIKLSKQNNRSQSKRKQEKQRFTGDASL